MNSTMKNNSMKTTRGQRNNNPLNIRRSTASSPPSCNTTTTKELDEHESHECGFN